MNPLGVNAIASRFQQSRDLDKFRASTESVARILLLIDNFSRRTTGPRLLEGRVKLAKLDFLLRYPHHLARVLERRGVRGEMINGLTLQIDRAPIADRMMRYRYGPWDPSYYAILGALIGRNLVLALPLTGKAGFGYRTTELGATIASNLLTDDSFQELGLRTQLLRRHLDLSGATLTSLLYELPEVADASWKEDIL